MPGDRLTSPQAQFYLRTAMDFRGCDVCDIAFRIGPCVDLPLSGRRRAITVIPLSKCVSALADFKSLSLSICQYHIIAISR